MDPRQEFHQTMRDLGQFMWRVAVAVGAVVILALVVAAGGGVATLVMLVAYVGLVSFFLGRASDDQIKQKYAKMFAHMDPRGSTVTVLSSLAYERTRHRFVSTAWLGIAGATYVILAKVSHTPIRRDVVVLLLCVIGFLRIGAFAFDFRLKRGLYGTTAAEAREILEFVQRYSDHFDFSGGLGAKSLEYDESENEMLAAAWEGTRA